MPFGGGSQPPAPAFQPAQPPPGAQIVAPPALLTPAAIDKIVQDDTENLRRMRYFRRQYDQQRLYFYRQYVSSRDQQYFPDNVTPRSNTFVPYPQATVEGIVSRVLAAYFSFEPWFECLGRYGTAIESASSMQRVLHYLLKKAGFRPQFETFVRNVAMYGHGGLMVDWDFDSDTVEYKQPIPAMMPITGPDGQPVIDPQTGQPAMHPIVNPQTGQPLISGYRPASKQVPRACPRFYAIDCYDLLVDPDYQIIGRMTERTLGQLEREAQLHPDWYIPGSIEKLGQKVRTAYPDQPEGIIIRMAELWKKYDQTMTVMTFGEDNDAVAWKDARAAIRGAGLSSFKRKAWGGEQILLWHGENPFAHKQIPILTCNYIKLPNEPFGLGAIETISALAEGMNRFVNMVTDNWNLGINKRYAYDINVDVDMTALNNFNVPGGKVGVNGPPAEVIQPLPDFSPNPADYEILSVYRSMIEMTSGQSDFYSRGVGSSGGNRSASGISQVQGEANLRFEMFSRNLEISVIEPMLKMCASMVMQFLTDPEEMLITGAGEPGFAKFPMVTPEELLGTFEFRLVAGQYATNKAVRQRNMLSFANIVADSPYINQYEGLKELGKVMEIPHMDKMLYTPEQVQQMQAAQQQQGLQMALFKHFLDMDREEEAHPNQPGQGVGGGRPKMNPSASLPGKGQYHQLVQEIAQRMGMNATGNAGEQRGPAGV
jgi:hypothetical protein